MTKIDPLILPPAPRKPGLVVERRPGLFGDLLTSSERELVAPQRACDFRELGVFGRRGPLPDRSTAPGAEPVVGAQAGAATGAEPGAAQPFDPLDVLGLPTARPTRAGATGLASGTAYGVGGGGAFDIRPAPPTLDPSGPIADAMTVGSEPCAESDAGRMIGNPGGRSDPLPKPVNKTPSGPMLVLSGADGALQVTAASFDPGASADDSLRRRVAEVVARFGMALAGFSLNGVRIKPPSAID